MSWENVSATLNHWLGPIKSAYGSTPKLARLVVILIIAIAVLVFLNWAGIGPWQVTQVLMFVVPLGVMMYPGWFQKQVTVNPARFAWVDSIRHKWVRIPLFWLRMGFLTLFGESQSRLARGSKLTVIYIICLIAIAIPMMAIPVWGLYFILGLVAIVIVGLLNWKRVWLRSLLLRFAGVAFIAVSLPIFATLRMQEFYVIDVFPNPETDTELVTTKGLDGKPGEPLELKAVPQVRFLAIGEAKTALKEAANNKTKVKVLVINVRFSPLHLYRTIVDYRIEGTEANGQLHFKWAWLLFGG